MFHSESLVPANCIHRAINLFISNFDSNNTSHLVYTSGMGLDLMNLWQLKVTSSELEQTFSSNNLFTWQPTMDTFLPLLQPTLILPCLPVHSADRIPARASTKLKYVEEHNKSCTPLVSLIFEVYLLSDALSNSFLCKWKEWIVRELMIGRIRQSFGCMWRDMRVTMRIEGGRMGLPEPQIRPHYA